VHVGHSRNVLLFFLHSRGRGKGRPSCLIVSLLVAAFVATLHGSTLGVVWGGKIASVGSGPLWLSFW
jgi:hypothetical protein